MNKTVKIANLFVAALRCIYLVHQHNHWITKGYGKHLAYERLYNTAGTDADKSAEKFIGIFGKDCVHYELQNKLISLILDRYLKIEDPVKRSLTIEKDFIVFAEASIKVLDKVSLGLDDLFTEVCNNRETACYLLNQIAS